MPRLWSDTVEHHRHQVREAILDTTASLAASEGPLSVTMSQIAEQTGIGRATLYKYFPDVRAILVAWHVRQVTGHLERLADVAGRVADREARLRSVLDAHALMVYEHHGDEFAAFVHQGEHVEHAQQRLSTFVEGVLTAATEAGSVRSDVPVNELASYCLHALAAAATLPSKAAVQRLVDITLVGMRPADDEEASMVYPELDGGPDS